jgi:opacity protein-like surface antigen
VRVLALLPLAACASGQSVEIGAAAGYGIYRNASVYAPAGVAVAGFGNRFTLSALLGQDLYEFVSGEVRYTYQDGDPFLEAGGVRTNVQGHSHAIHYDLLFHARSRSRRWRPYFAAGLGAKHFAVSGPANPGAPLGEIARLTTEGEFKPLVTAGGGVRFAIRPRVALRLDFRDYFTPFPKTVIAPAPYGTARGFFHQFTALAGVSFTP